MTMAIKDFISSSVGSGRLVVVNGNNIVFCLFQGKWFVLISTAIGAHDLIPTSYPTYYSLKTYL